MFQLDDKRRHRACLAIFFACLVPTLCVLVIGLWRHRPGYEAEAARQLGLHLGLNASVETVVWPKPGMLVYRGVKLADPETGELLVQCDRVTVQSSGDSKTGPVVFIEQCGINMANAEPLRRLAQRVLTKNTGWPDLDARLSAEKVFFSDHETQQTLYQLNHVGIIIERSRLKSLAEIRFQWAGVEGKETSLVRLARTRVANRPVTTIDLQTGPTPLPCPLLALGSDHFARFESKSWFDGQLVATYQAGDLAGQLTGQFFAPGTDQPTPPLTYALSGPAGLSIMPPGASNYLPHSPATEWLLSRLSRPRANPTAAIAERPTGTDGTRLE